MMDDMMVDGTFRTDQSLLNSINSTYIRENIPKPT